MIIKNVVEKANQLNLKDPTTTGPVISKNWALQELPVGWKYLGQLAYALATFLQVDITKISYQKGTLQVEGKCYILGNEVKEHDEIFKLFCQGLAKKSATTCIVTGNRGIRRKIFDSWPPLSEEKYIQYLNEQGDEFFNQKRNEALEKIIHDK